MSFVTPEKRPDGVPGRAPCLKRPSPLADAADVHADIPAGTTPTRRCAVVFGAGVVVESQSNPYHLDVVAGLADEVPAKGPKLTAHVQSTIAGYPRESRRGIADKMAEQVPLIKQAGRVIRKQASSDWQAISRWRVPLQFQNRSKGDGINDLSNFKSITEIALAHAIALDSL
ncbi:hypothetical protein ColLi_09063 [Colletotrichum liriopes]|uniref:Uncharacterized protein n=1 Tax=Colletotrichum liriopes TaxID=708192 RepID=A0AA37GS85_9PEZI|nr:hypothetical protein ColLi_09063 [Colletotrichum liriopes]